MNKGSTPVTVMVSREPDSSGNFVCDGTNDTVRIQAALVHANVLGGGEVILLLGVYLTTAQTTIYDNTIVGGMGQGATTVRSNGGAFDIFSMDGWHIIIRDMTLDTQTNNGRACVSSDTASGYGTSYSMLFNVRMLGGTKTATIFWPNALAYQGPGAVAAEQLVPFNIISHCYVYSQWDQDIVNFTHQYQGLLIGNTFWGRVIIHRNRGTIVDGNRFYGTPASANALQADGPSWYCTISNNTFRYPFLSAIYLDELQFNATWYYVQGFSIIGNTVENSNSHAFVLGSGDQAGYVRDTVISGNTITTTASGGILLTGAQFITVSDNTITDPNAGNGPNIAGIQVHGDYNVITDNTIIDRRVTKLMNMGIGIGKRDAQSASYNLVTGNTVHWSDNWGIAIADDTSNPSQYNVVEHNHILNTDNEAIIEEDRGGGTDYNCIRFNRFTGVVGVNKISIAGAHTVLESKSFQFQHGGNADGIQAAQFIHADASAKGWEIDAAAEWAIALGHIPLEVQYIIRIKLWAVSLAAAPGAGNHMRANFLINTGESHALFNAEPVSVAGKNCEEANPGTNDVIHWILTRTDDADINHIRGGESIEVKVNHNAGGNSDVGTDAVFRAVEIEYA